MTNEEIRSKLAEAFRRIEALEKALTEVQGHISRVYALRAAAAPRKEDRS